MISKSRFLPNVLSSHTVSSVARLSWLRIAGAIASLRPLTGTKVSPCELRHSARTGSERFLDTACEHWHTACQKTLGIYLCLRRSGELRCVCAGVPRKYLTCRRKHHRFASTRTDIDGKQTHDGFSIPACLNAKTFHPNCRATSRGVQGKASRCGIPQHRRRS